MGEVSKTVGEWIVANFGWSVILFLFLFSLFFEFSKIKLNPITALCKRIGNAFTAGVKQDIEELRKDTNKRFEEFEGKTSKALRDIKENASANCATMKDKLNEIEEKQDNQAASRIKAHVFNFAKECYRGEKHTKGDFENVINENKIYERLVEKHGWKNDVYTKDFAYIEREYQRCLDEHDFQPQE